MPSSTSIPRNTPALRRLAGVVEVRRLVLLFPPTVGQIQITENWYQAKDGNEHARALFHRHYSYRPYKDGREPKLFCGPGEKMVLLTKDADALFVWRKFKCADGNEGINCAVFRNESKHLASSLILEAEEAAWTRWKPQRLFTYVKARAIKSSNPGYCFIKAGWSRCGVTKWNKLTILEKQNAIGEPAAGSPTH